MCQILGFNNEKISKIAHFSDSDLIGIDFFPSPKNLKNLKIYNHYKKLNRNLISRVFKNNNLKASKNLIDNLLLLNKEKSGSWYLLHRFNQDSELESIKFFKIYEFQKITGMGNLTEELKLFFSKLNKKEKNSWQILKRNFVDKYSFSQVREASLAINGAMGYAVSKNIKTGFDGLPDCLVDDPDLKDNLQTNNILYMSEVFEDRFYRTDEGQRIKGKCCQFCSRKKLCPGIYEGYRRCGGLSDLKPIR